MNETLVLSAIVVFLALFLATEIASAALPLILIVALVPPEERPALAQLIAATDSSWKLRLWPALRLAVRARRRQR